MSTPIDQLDSDSRAVLDAMDAHAAKGTPSDQPAVKPAAFVQQPQLQAETPQIDPDAAAADKLVDQFSGPPGSGTPNDPYKGLVEFTQKVQESYQVGQNGIREAALGHAVAEGKLTLEEAQRRIDQDEHAKWQSNDVDQYEKRNWNNWAQGLLVSGTMEGAKSLPAMAASFSEPLKPEDTIGGPILGLMPMARWTAHYIFGQDYLRRRQLGAPHDEAAKFAIANAAGQTVVQVLSMMPVGSVALNAAKAPIAAGRPFVARALAGIASHLWSGAKFTAAQEALGTINQAVQTATDAIEATVSHHPNMMPTVEQAAKEWGENFVKTLAVSAIMHTGSVGAGVGFRGVAKAFDAASEVHLQAQQAKLAKIEEQRTALQQALQGHIEDNVTIKPMSPAEARRAQQLAQFQEQKTRLAQQENQLTQLDDQIKSGKRRGNDTGALEQQRQALMDDTKLLSDIVDSNEAIERHAAKSRLNRLLKLKAETNPELDYTRQLVAHYTENPQEAVKLVAEGAEQEASGKPIEESSDKAFQREVAQFVLDHFDETGNGYELRDSETINRLADQIELSYKAGRANRLKDLARVKRVRDANVALFKEMANYKDDVPTGVNRPLKSKGVPLPQRLIGGFVSIFGNIEQNFAVVFRDNPHFDEYWRDHLDPSKVISYITAGVEKWDHRRFELLAEATGVSKNQVLELQRIGRLEDQIIITTKSGEQTGRSAMEVVKMLGEMRDPETKQRFIDANNFPEDIEDSLTKDLGKLENGAYVKMVDGYEKFYEEYFPELNKNYRADKNVDLRRIAHYAGYVSAEKGEEVGAEKLIASLEKPSLRTRAAVAPGFTKERTSKSAIQPQDAEQAARSQVRLGEQYKGWWQPAKELYAPILRDPEVIRLIRNKSGNQVLRGINKAYTYLLRGMPQTDLAFGKLLDRMFANVRFNQMANNWLYMPKHFLSQFAPSPYIPMVDYYRGLADYYKNPIKTAQLIEAASADYRKRYEDVEQTVSGSTLPQTLQNPKFPKWFNDLLVNYHKFGWTAVTTGSKTQVLPIIHSVFQYMKKQGMDDEAALHQAVMAAEKVGTSARPDLTSNLAHTDAGKWFLVFQQQPNKFGVDQILAWDRFAASPSAETLQHAVKVQLSAGLANATFPLVNAAYTAAIGGITGDDKKLEEAQFQLALAGFHILMPGISAGVIATPAVDAIATEVYNQQTGSQIPAFEFTLPMLTTIWNNVEFVKTILHAWGNDSWDEDSKKLIHTGFTGPGNVLPLGAKAPAEAAEKLMEK